MKAMYVYTDGSAVSRGDNKGKGGFGTYFPNQFGKKRGFSLGFKNTKTGRMEVMALYYAINKMPETCLYPVSLHIYSDSEYVIKSFTENRLERWIKAGWRNTSGEVKNKDLWKLIVREINKKTYLKLEFHHIKSHQLEKEKDPIKRKELLKNPHIIGNAMADTLADYKRHKKLLESDIINRSNI